jgi:hypothetical protein
LVRVGKGLGRVGKGCDGVEVGWTGWSTMFGYGASQAATAKHSLGFLWLDKLIAKRI